MTSSIIRRRRSGLLASGRLMLYCLTPDGGVALQILNAPVRSPADATESVGQVIFDSVLPEPVRHTFVSCSGVGRPWVLRS